MKPRLAFVTSHPIQYQAPLFRALTTRGEVDVKVFFASEHGLRPSRDPGFGNSFQWDVPLLDGYAHEFVRNYAQEPTPARFFGLLTPTIGVRVAEFRPDVVVAHGYSRFSSLLATLDAGLRGTPVLLRGESNLLPKRSAKVRSAKRLGAAALRRVLYGGVAIGSLNRAYYRHYGFPEERIFFAPYAVDNERFSHERDATRARAMGWRRELGIGDEELVVGYAAKFIPVKDCGTLIEAFGRAHVPDSALLLVGDGAQRAELEALAARFPHAKIRFTGFVNQQRMPEAYAAADVFVLPSVFEPWGLAVNEAMCLGRPIVASDQVGSAPDLVGDDNGWVFPAGNVAALERVLAEALRDRARLEEMGRASTRRIATWGIPECAAGFEHATHTVLRQLGRAPGARA